MKRNMYLNGNFRVYKEERNDVKVANIFDYMDWRDISIKKVEFNEIDNLILARLSYFPFDGIIKENEEITIKESYDRYKNNGTTGRILQKEDIDLFPILANSTRFGNMKITNFINKLDPIQEKQFCAITIIMPDDTIYVAYRGTDNTIIGWKEDFNMSFSDLVPAQIDATSYLENIAEKYNNKIRVGGHSKGGNLAVYAASFCKDSVKNRIINVYNNDGPGFCEKVIKSREYEEILDRVQTFIPQTSIIGRLLNHEEKTTILKSTETGIMQHDLYSWQVLGDKFVKDEQTNSSKLIDKTITDWLKAVSPEQREIFIDTFFEILNATGAKTLSEIGSNKVLSIRTMLKTYQDIDQETKEIMLRTLKIFMEIGRNNFVTIHSRNVN